MMSGILRYALYHMPPPGPLADFGAAWLGWDAVAGQRVPHPAVPPLKPEALTATPRNYGFHATIKAPFALAAGCTPAGLEQAVAALAQHLAPVSLPGLHLTDLGGVLALTPATAPPELTDLAARAVVALDEFRAPLTPADRARRLASGLTARQVALLDQWGYPFVMEEFHLHLTLTGSLPPPDCAEVAAALAPVLAPLLTKPYRIDSLSLCGQAADGRFRQLRRFPLSD